MRSLVGGRHVPYARRLSRTGLIMGLLFVALIPQRPALMRSTLSQPLPLQGKWVSTSLTAIVNALVIIPGQHPRIIAGTDNGIWRSADDGLSWQPDRGSPHNNVFALSATPTGTAYAGGSDGRVYLWQGSAWQPISPPLTSTPIFSVAASSRSQTVLAGGLGALFRGTDDREGWHWQAVVQTLSAPITSLTWVHWDQHVAFATAFEAVPPVLISYDDGQTWQRDTKGLPSRLPTQSIRSGMGATLQLYLSTMGGGVWLRSASGGWSDISAGLPHRHAMPLLATDQPGLLYAGTMGNGVYEKQNGTVWRQLGHGLGGTSAIVLALAETGGTHSTLLAGTEHGLFRYVLP